MQRDLWRVAEIAPGLGDVGLALAGVGVIVLRPSRAIFKPLLVRPRL